MGAENVKLGVCRVKLGGVDLGYTKGGVSVEVTTDTYPVTVDQFGESEINEYIMKRSVKVSVPLAETTLENLVNIMPGATLIENGGSVASGTVTFGANPADGETLTLNGAVFTFKTVASGSNDVLIGASLGDTLDNLVVKLSASTAPAIASATYADDGVDELTITYKTKTELGNAYTLAASVALVSAATLSGGVSGKKRVDVVNAIGTDLLSTAKELTLHPIENAESDTSEDFTVFKAATAGALNFAYKVDEERIYNVEFTGYPDQNNGDKLFAVGDLDA